jgi:type VI protein secretion system component Hcp
VRGNIHLWGSSEEIRMHKELSAMTEHKDKTSVEISEMIFEKRVDLQLRKQLYREIHHKDYDGGDL